MFWGLLSGLATSGLTVWWLAARKKTELEEYLHGLERAAQTGQGTTEMQQRVVQMRTGLENYAKDYVKHVAEKTGKATLSDTYSITPQRISQVKTLGRRLGVS